MSDQDAPDLRLQQANERTLLAWVRTGAGLSGFGFVLERSELLFPAGRQGGFLEYLGVAMIILGVVANVCAAAEYRRIRSNLIAKRTPLGSAHFGPLVAIVAALLGLMLAIGLLLE
ncbi:MAG: DUF202 domain-containing protein [Deltaproteobacteria bacterium]|nr:DUF202 domain-containing protein [Deltaproteobacteria bacterium]